MLFYERLVKISVLKIVSVKFIGGCLLVDFVKITGLRYLTASNTHHCVLVHYVTTNVLHKPKTFFGLLYLPSQTEIVELS